MAVATSTILLGLAIGGAAASATSSVRAGHAQRELEQENARIADQQAADALARGEQDVARFRMGVQQVRGTQRAGYAAQNVRVDTGSAAVVAADTEYLARLDEDTIRQNAAREAWGYRVQAVDSRRRGDLAAAEGRNRALGTLIGTGTSLVESRYGFGRGGR